MQIKRAKRNISGVLLLDKPIGITSNEALQTAKRLFNAAKAGHTGTLDPLATGLLPLCFGEATKFAQYPTDADKRYDATISLGIRTDSGDKEGQVLARLPVKVSLAAIEEALAHFRGPSLQMPPMYSALKFQGQALYKYARAGVTVERQARPVVFHEISLNQFAEDALNITVACSKGAYIRVLAEDIGDYLGCGAHLSALRRTGVGGFSLAQTITMDELNVLDQAQRDTLLLPADVLVSHLSAIQLEANAAAYFRLGQAVYQPHLTSTVEYKVYDEKQSFIGIAWVNAEGKLAPKRLVVQS